jgi:hypothetical protein
VYIIGRMALHILKPEQWFQLEMLYEGDGATQLRWDRVTGGGEKQIFKITDKNISATAINSGNMENNNLKSLNNNVRRQRGVSTNDLVATVNATLIDSLAKAEKQKTQDKKFSPRELANLKKGA